MGHEGGTSTHVKLQVVSCCLDTSDRDRSCGHARVVGRSALCVHGAVGSREIPAPTASIHALVWNIPDWCPLEDAVGRLVEWK